MNLFAKALLGTETEYVVNVLTVRGNKFVIDNSGKKITVYKKVSGGGTIYNMDFLPVLADGFKTERPSELGPYTNGGVTYWRSANTNANKGTQTLYFDIIDQKTQNIVATYELILDWTKEG